MDIKLDKQNDEGYERWLGFLIQDVARLMRLVFDRQVRDVGLTRAQWFVLAHLIRNDGQRQTDLAIETDMEKAPLGKLIDRLEEGGWVERRPDPSDMRAKRIYKTGKIDPLIPLIKNTATKVYEIALAGLSVDAQEHLVFDLLTIKKNLMASQSGSKVSSGGLKRARHPMPPFISDALKENGLEEDYASRPPYQQNDYIGWIIRAKREQTRQKRLAQMLAELKSGNVYMKMKWQPRRG